MSHDAWTGPPCGSVQSGALPAGAPGLRMQTVWRTILPASLKRKVSVQCVKPELGQRQMRKTDFGLPSST